MAGFYIHIPFCEKKCLYCDFYSLENQQNYFSEYVDALLRDINKMDDIDKKRVETVYIGGGTPTALPCSLLKRLLETINENFSPIEFTVEANPGTVDEEKASMMKNCGVTRVSIGLQAWQDRLLKIIGRIHTRRQFLDAVKLFEKYGFSINVDVMFNLPTQTLDEWEETLNSVASLGISHISCYCLTLAENTPFGKNLPAPLPSEETERKMQKMAVDILEKYGIFRYEISNFSKPGCECKHNLCYWSMNDYYAFGAGAHGFLDGVRYFYPDDVLRYIEKGDTETEEILTKDDVISEYMMLAFRLSCGVSKKEFSKRFGASVEELFKNEIDKNIKLGLIYETDDAIRLTPKGFDFESMVAEDFI